MTVDNDSAPIGLDGADITALMHLDQLDTNLFRNRHNQPNLNGALYGGQVFGQALAAAVATIEDRPVHSCHGYFLCPGQIGRRVIFDVERTRDGGSFSSRRVVAYQNAAPILHLECSFHVPEPGFDHARAVPDRPDPETLPRLQDHVGWAIEPSLLEGLSANFDCIDIRPIGKDIFARSMTPHRQCWLRIRSTIAADDQSLHRLMLAYLSDFWLSGVSMMPHGIPFPNADTFLTSLDHAIWFHRDVQISEWLLYDTESPSASQGIGLSRGLIYDRAGRLVASTAQEALIRRRR